MDGLSWSGKEQEAEVERQREDGLSEGVQRKDGIKGHLGDGVETLQKKFLQIHEGDPPDIS